VPNVNLHKKSTDGNDLSRQLMCDVILLLFACIQNSATSAKDAAVTEIQEFTFDRCYTSAALQRQVTVNDPLCVIETK